MNWIELGNSALDLSKINYFSKTEKFDSHSAEKTYQITFTFDENEMVVNFPNLAAREYAYRSLLLIANNDINKTIHEILAPINKNYQAVDIEEEIGFPCYELIKNDNKVDKYKEHIQVNASYACVDFGNTKENKQEPHFLSFDTIENMYNLMKKLKEKEEKQFLDNLNNVNMES